MTDCNSLPEEYGPIESMIEKIVRDENGEDERHLDCIKRNIENAESIEDLTLASDELKIYRLKLIEDVVEYLKGGAKSHNGQKSFVGIYHKTFPYGRIKNSVLEFIGKKVDEKIAKNLRNINKAIVSKVETIANSLNATGYSITIGMPFTFTVTLNFDVK